MSINAVSSGGNAAFRVNDTSYSVTDVDPPPGIAQDEWDSASESKRAELIQEAESYYACLANAVYDKDDDSWGCQDHRGVVYVVAGRPPETHKSPHTTALHPALWERTGDISTNADDDIYRIRPGDTYGSIALAHGMTEKALDAANPELKDKNKLKAGNYLSVSGYTKKPEPVLPPARPEKAPIGWLAAQYESGKKGLHAVGWDKTGGTSYGTYQISSLTMQDFFSFVKDKNQAIYEKLSPFKIDGGIRGDFSKAWQELASSPKHRPALMKNEYAFIESRVHTALGKIQSIELQEKVKSSVILQEVVWSIAVHHGPNTEILNEVFKEGMSGEDFIRAVYAKRGVKFTSSTQKIQTSVYSRLADEAEHALYLFAQEQAKKALGAAVNQK